MGSQISEVAAPCGGQTEAVGAPTATKKTKYSKRHQDAIPLKPSEATKEVLQRLGLTEYYPSRISLQDVMSVGERQSGESNLAWSMLRRLIMLDHRGRDILAQDIYDDYTLAGDNTSYHDEFGIDDFLSDIKDEKEEEQHLNPIEIFTVVYACCDMILKQVLLQKMFLCRLAIPFISPDLSVEDNLAFSLWALRGIIIDWKKSNDVCIESSVVDQPMKIVSLMRLGRPSLSKSVLLNHVITNQSNHTFWNRECQWGNSVHPLSDGLVETQWYLPSGKDADVFQEVTMFANLRGDACDKNKQVDLITSISNVVVCCIHVKEMNRDDIIRMMKVIHEKARKVVLLLETSDATINQTEHLKKDLDQYISHIGRAKMSNTKIVSTLTENKGKTNDELRQDLHRILQPMLSEEHVMSIVEVSNMARQFSIAIDEDDCNCSKAKDLACDLVTCMGKKPTNELKREMLPLQSHTWQNWVRLLKESQSSIGKDPNADISKELESLESRMMEMRQDQLLQCRNMCPLMKGFLQHLLTESDIKSVMLFMQWLKLHLDEMSRETIPSLQQEYNKKWVAFSQSRTKDTKHKKAQLQKELMDAERNLADASIGVEHILREVAQIYEATIEGKMEVKQTWQDIVSLLPNVAAKLLLEGHPIEIMDGDAGCVPLTWVTALFTDLAKLVGDKKLFAISILGVQSSGKSTLLNTMFGLQFAVSAGRCTRGVYMQLLPVDKDRSNLPYDYALVIDTEGLRAPELGHLKYDNDNQLATFVIGLGDVTILNVKGENMAEITDVLQIAVHAFLRMKLDKRKPRTCIFVHQNVPAVNAVEKMKYGCQKIKDKLDDMTADASGIEDIVHVCEFNDVIQLAGQRSVWYFSDLWLGNPPMAPVNTGYVESAVDLKDHILKCLAMKQRSFLTFSEMKAHIKNVWKGILADSFVFKFKNSLAAKAFNTLDAIYHQKSLAIQCGVHEWITHTACARLNGCANLQELNEVSPELAIQLEVNVSLLKENAISELDEFFETHDQKEILVEWKAEKLNSLSNETVQFIDQAQGRLNEKITATRIDLLHKTEHQQQMADIDSRAQTVAHTHEGKSVAEDVMRDTFEKGWERLVADSCSGGVSSMALQIDKYVEAVLRKRLMQDSTLVHQELLQNPISNNEMQTKCILYLQDISEDHLSINISNKKLTFSECRHAALSAINDLLLKVESYLAGVSAESAEFENLYVLQIIDIIISGMKESNGRTRTMFTMTKSFQIKVIVHACCTAAIRLAHMQHSYEEGNSSRRKMEKYKESAWNHFKDKVNQSTVEINAAELLLEKLGPPMLTSVQSVLQDKVVEHGLKMFGFQKTNLIGKIMQDLTDQSFADYMAYIDDPRRFAVMWMKVFLDNEIFSDNNAKSIYQRIVEEHVSTLTGAIRRSITKAGEYQTMTYRIDSFCQNLKELSLTSSDLECLMTFNIDDFGHFSKQIFKRLKEHKEMVLDHCKQGRKRWDGAEPCETIVARLWGCEALCPFCNEICQKTSANHLSSNDSHMCIQHRPSAVRGTKAESLAQPVGLALQTCNYDVQSELIHGCSVCRYECQKQGRCTGGIDITNKTDILYDLVRKPIETFFHLLVMPMFNHNILRRAHVYRQYKSYLPHWDIAPSANNEPSKYWMWFVAKYKDELAHHYDSRVGIVPGSWEQVTKEEAIESLNVYFC